MTLLPTAGQRGRDCTDPRAPPMPEIRRECGRAVRLIVRGEVPRRRSRRLRVQLRDRRLGDAQHMRRTPARPAPRRSTSRDPSISRARQPLVALDRAVAAARRSPARAVGSSRDRRPPACRAARALSRLRPAAWPQLVERRRRCARASAETLRNSSTGVAELAGRLRRAGAAGRFWPRASAAPARPRGPARRRLRGANAMRRSSSIILPRQVRRSRTSRTCGARDRGA